MVTWNSDEFMRSMAAKHINKWDDTLIAFAKESNAIEGIYDDIMLMQYESRLRAFLELDEITVSDLCAFNEGHGVLRTNGECVTVGNHTPPKGGQAVLYSLVDILHDVNLGELDPWFMHIEFETLHPFTDGNGRTGRAIWAWQKVNQEGRNLSNLFLQQWYYDTLEQSRK